MPVPLALNRMKGNKGIKQDWDETMLADGQVQPNMYPAKYSFSTTTASCASDFVVYPTGVAGTATTANVVAYYNLYTTGCSGTVPAVNWAYNTGAMVTTSPVLSLDGTQVAFIQVSGTAASLVLMKWAQTPATITTLVGNLNATNNSTTPGVTLTTGTFSASDVGARISDTTTSGDIATGVTITSVLSSTTALLSTAPTTATAQHLTISAETLAAPGVPPTVAAASYHACTAPCMTTITFSGSHNDTYSSPYYDYIHDAIYVGDNSGNLQKFTPVFGTGTPAVGTPVSLNTAPYDIASPVYDSTSGCVFVGDTEGYFYCRKFRGRWDCVHQALLSRKWGTSEILGNGAALEGIFDAPLSGSRSEWRMPSSQTAPTWNLRLPGITASTSLKLASYPQAALALPHSIIEEALGAGASKATTCTMAPLTMCIIARRAVQQGILWVMGNTGSGLWR